MFSLLNTDNIRIKNKLKQKENCSNGVELSDNSNQTDVIRKDIDLPWCCGLCDLGRPWISSLNDTDFSNDTDLSAILNEMIWISFE